MNTLNIAMMLEHAARQVPDKTFIIAGEQRFTFGQIEAQARRSANALAGLGIKLGDRVALMLPNAPVFPICYFGALKLGAVCVPLNVRSPGPEVAYFLADSEAVAMIALEPFAEAALEGFEATETCRHLIMANLPGSDACPAPAQRLTELMNAAEEDFETALTRPEEPAVILYTAGTTGRPKGAVLTHFNYHFFSNLQARDLWCIEPEDVLLIVVPFSHMAGQAMLNAACVAQAQASLMSRFDPEAFLRTIERDKVTCFMGIPTIAHYMLHSPLTDRYDLSSLHKVVLGGAPVHPEIAKQFKERFQVDLGVVYASTEASPMTFTHVGTEGVPPGSVGTPVWGTGIRIVSEQGDDVPTGELGEVVTRGPQVFSGYYKQPDESASAWRDGWLHTGDVGRMDEQGHLFIEDRLKDMIKCGGYSVFPAEVERVLHTHPAVSEAAIIGVPHKALGERIKAFVVLKPGAVVTARELIDHCKAQLATYKCPRRIEFRDDLPKSPTGKILRRVLREQ